MVDNPGINLKPFDIQLYKLRYEVIKPGWIRTRVAQKGGRNKEYTRLLYSWEETMTEYLWSETNSYLKETELL